MTDPIADLRRDLLEAAHRTPARARIRPLLMAAAAVAVVAIAVTGIATLSGGGDPEREAAAPPVATAEPEPGTCVPEGDGRGGVDLGPVPDTLSSRLGVLREPSGEEDSPRSLELPQGPQVAGVYTDAKRLAIDADDQTVYIAGAAVISRDDLPQNGPGGKPAGKSAEKCSGGELWAAPGACVISVNSDGGAGEVCFTVPEIDRGASFLDNSKVPGDTASIAGMAPDGVHTARLHADGRTFDAKVVGNAYTLTAEIRPGQLYEDGTRIELLR